MNANKKSQYKTFWMFFKETRKYRELWREDASRYALVLAVVFFILLQYLFLQNSSDFFTNISNVLMNIVCGFIGLVGVVITGMALLLTTIRSDFINYINEKGKRNKFVGVLFCFYFAGAMVLATIVTFLLEYFILKIESAAISWLVSVCIFISCYLFFLSLCYTVALIGTCINVFVLEQNRVNR